MGTPDFSTKVLEMLIAEHEVIAVVTQPDRPVGRKKVMTPPPVKRVAKSIKYRYTSLKNLKILKN